ncbi:MAG TPA: ribose 5-phosphate isomerase B [Anseongella sp.]
MKIAIGGDHAGFNYKQSLVGELEALGHEVKDFGPHSGDPVDYPDFVHPVAKHVAASDYDLGILLCGSANGVAITANKHKGVRAAICWLPELAELGRSHNNANICCIPARFTTLEEATTIMKTFLSTAFEGGRHARRVDKIDCQ